MLKRLKALREAAGLSQERLGKIVGVSQQSINSYENHAIEPDIETLSRMADIFNTSIDYLVGYTDIRHKIEPVTPYDLNSHELQVLEDYRKLTPAQQDLIAQMIRSYQTL